MSCTCVKHFSSQKNAESYATVMMSQKQQRNSLTNSCNYNREVPDALTFDSQNTMRSHLV